MQNPTRLDPTRTTMQRQAFATAVHVRMMRIRSAILNLVGVEDAFGLAPRDMTFSPFTTNARWTFSTDDKKIEAYQDWLKAEVDKQLLTVDPANKNTPWVQPYIGKAYKTGIARAYMDTHKGASQDKSLDFVQGGKEGFLKMAFEGPVGQTKLRTLSTRAFSQLKGITAAMDQEMTRILAQGLAQGKNPKVLARELSKSVVGLDRKRAMVIARTEIVHAHNEGQLDSFEAMNKKDVGIMAEWSTAADGLVCPLCAPLEGIVLTIKEARGMLPRHPNCRCAWIPANVSEHEGSSTETKWAGKEQGLDAPGTKPTGQVTGQVWDQDTIEQRIRQSLRAEKPRSKNPAADSKWVGADVSIIGKLKPGTAAWVEEKAAAKRLRDMEARRALRLEKKAKEAAAKEAAAKEAAAKAAKEAAAKAKKKSGPAPGDAAFIPGKDAEDAWQHFSKIGGDAPDKERDLLAKAYKEMVRWPVGTRGYKEAEKEVARAKRLVFAKSTSQPSYNHLLVVEDPAKPKAVTVKTVTKIHDPDGTQKRRPPTADELAAFQVGLDTVARYVSADVGSFKIGFEKFEGYTGRAFAYNMRMAVDPAKTSTILHEWGHLMEENNKNVHEACVDFLKSRTKGEKPIKLRDLIPGSRYGDGEVAYKDRWAETGASPYVGKVYANNTEVLSMGLERMIKDPSKFAKEDPSYFKLVWNIMRGNIK